MAESSVLCHGLSYAMRMCFVFLRGWHKTSGCKLPSRGPAPRRRVLGYVLRFGTLAWVLLAVGTGAALADGPPKSLSTALERRIGLEWKKMPLRKGLEKLTRHEKCRLFLDRRLDPDQCVSLSISTPMPFGIVLHRIAARVDAAIVPVGEVLYFVPRPHSWAVSDAHDRLARSLRGTPGLERTGAHRRLRWSLASRPAEILQAWCASFQVRLDARGRIPHDLWPETDLGEVTLSEGVTLLVTGFGLEARWDAAREQIVLRRTDPQALVVGRAYFFAQRETRRSDLETLPEGRRVRWRRTRPWWIAEGPPHALTRLSEVYAHAFEGHPRAGKSGTQDLRRTRLTFRVENQPLGAVLKTLQQRLALTLEIAPDVQHVLTRRVSFRVERATLDATLKAALEPLELSHKRTGHHVRIFRSSR